MNQVIAWLTSMLLCPGIVYGATLSRQDVVNTAQGYVDAQVTLSASNLTNPSGSPQCDGRLSIRQNLDFSFCAGASVQGETYKWFGDDLTTDYSNNVSAGKKVVLPHSSFNDPNYTGIDCSGLVFRAWGLSGSKLNTSGLAAITQDVAWSAMRKGDIFLNWNDPNDLNHAALLKEDLSPTSQSANIIHSTWKHFAPKWPIDAYRVVNDNPVPIVDEGNGTKRLRGFKVVMHPRTPFPLFSNFTPADGAAVGSSQPFVSATIQSATTIDQDPDTLQILIDDNPQTGLSISGSGGLVTISGTASDTLSDGNHTMTVAARTYDTASGLDLSDVSSGLDFRVDMSAVSGDAKISDGVSTGPATTDKCLFFRGTNDGSGIAAVSVTGPNGFSVPEAQYSCASEAMLGPYCDLSSGTYTTHVRNCAGTEGTGDTVVSTAPYKLEISASGPTGSYYSSQEVAPDAACNNKLSIVVSGPCGGTDPPTCMEMQTGWGTCRADMYSCFSAKLEISSPSHSQSFSISNTTDAAVNFGISINAYLGGNSVSISFPYPPALAFQQSISGWVGVPAQNCTKWHNCNANTCIDTPLATIWPSTTTPSETAWQAWIKQALAKSSTATYIRASEDVLLTTATITFSYQAPAGVATDTATLRIYRFDGSSWEHDSIFNQSVSRSSSGWITAVGYSTRTSSYYATFFDVPDSSAPMTSLSIQGSTFVFDSTLFVSTDAFVVLAATDPMVNGFASQVAVTYYSIDPASGTPWSVYASSIPLPLGPHVFEYYSRDWKGNNEAVKISTFIVTVGAVFKTTSSFLVTGNLNMGFMDSPAKLNVESRAENDYTLLVSSPGQSTMLAVDNIGNVTVGASLAQARLDIAGVPSGAALALRSGNSPASTSSVQIAFGYNGTDTMRHALLTSHGANAGDNRMDFHVWNPSADAPATIAANTVLSLQAMTSASGGSFHVCPAGTPDVELVVSNGVTTGGGTIRRLEAQTPSSQAFKSDIHYLGEKEQEKAWKDVARLKPAQFRYKVRRKDGALADDPTQPLLKGYIYEDVPESIRGQHNDILFDQRLANVELALKAAMNRLAKLQKRLKTLQAGGKP